MADPKQSYAAAKLDQLNRLNTFRIYGNDLGFDQPAAAARRGWRPIGPCFCVQDAPDSPCPCEGYPVFWLWAESIVAEGPSGREGHGGKDLQFYDVLVDAKIMVESVQAVSAGALKALGDKVTPQRIAEVAAGPCGRDGGGGGGGAPTTIARNPLWDIFIGIVVSAIWEELTSDKSWIDRIRELAEEHHKKPPT